MPEPVTWAEAQAHLRLTGDEEQTLVESLIVAAREWVEGHTGQVLTARTVTQQVRGFGPWIELYAWPVRGVTSVTYSTDGAAAVTLPTSGYYRRLGRPERLFAIGSWPVARADVVVTVDAGYATPEDVPQSLKQAILLQVGHWYDTRGDSKDGVPPAVVALCRQHRLTTV